MDAAIRRLYVIPFKLGQYDKFHGPIQRENPLYSKLQYFSESLERENDKLSRMFNFIVTFSIFQTDVNSLVFDYNMQYYFQKLVRDSRETVFGMFYIMNKEKVDRIIASVEKAMIQPDINDTEYIAEFAIGVGELGQLMRSFVSRMAENNSEVQKEIVDDTSVPWHIRMYYIKSSMLFVNKVSCQCDNFEQCLNEDVRNFITDRRIQQFVMDDFDAYGDLDHNPIDSDDQITAIINEKIGEDSCLGKRQQRKFSVGLSILED